MASPASGWTAVSEAPPAASGWTAVDENAPAASSSESHPVLDAVKDFASGAWSKLSPVQILKGMADTVEAAAADPAGTAKNFGKEVLAHPIMAMGRAIDAAKQGNIEEALAHFDSALSPTGFMTEASQVKAATPGQRATGFGELVGTGANAYLTAKLPEFPKAAANAAGKVLDVVPEAVGDKALQAGAGVISPRAKNIMIALDKMKQARAAYQEANVSAARPASTPPPLPAQPPPIPLPASRQLPPSSVIVTPPPADTSGVIPGWKPTILENENTPAASVPAAAPPAPDLDGVAQGFGFKDFAAVKSPRAAETIRRVANQAAMPNQAKAAFNAARAGTPPPEAPPEAPPPQNPAPTPPPPAAPAAPTAVTPPAGAIDAPAQLPPKLITQKQLTQWANENGLSVDDAEAQLAADHNTRVIDRSTLNRTLHAITGDHETLSDIAKSTYRVDSLRKLSDEQMLELADKLSKEQAEPDLTGDLEQSLAQARNRRAAAAKNLGPPVHPGKAAFEAARAKR